ncbi:MAG: OadG family protein, partial [Porphyromonadaceae bacterium]|nr:OadG family protein [Porphyromonadaceae bacterium]
VNADGSTVIDQVTIPAASIVADRSYGRKMDGKDGWSILSKVTPSTNNVTLDSNEKIDRLKNEDSIGGIMTITAMTVVFSALLMLSIAFMIIGRQAISFSRRRASKQSEQQEVSEDMVSIPGEVIAAMSMALKSELDDLHDDDSNVLTICRVERKYTPWSSKIYGLRQLPDRSMQPRFRK